MKSCRVISLFTFTGILFVIGLVGCSATETNRSVDSESVERPHREAASHRPLRAAPRPETHGEFIDPFDGVTVTTLDNEEKKLSAQMVRGKATLLVFWASWCTICRAETPKVKEIHSSFSGRGLKVIGLNVNETPSKARSTAKRWGIEYSVAIITMKQTTDVFTFEGTPWHILIDGSGKIVYAGRDLPEHSAIEALLS